MNSLVARWRRPVSAAGLTATSVILALATPYAADNARRIIEEVQRRTDTMSQQYEGLLQVVEQLAHPCSMRPSVGPSRYRRSVSMRAVKAAGWWRRLG